MSEKLIISFEEYLDTVEKLAVEIHKNFKPTVLVGIMRGAAPIIDILSRIMKLPTAYVVIQSYSGEGMEDRQGQLIFARDISSIANEKDFNRVFNRVSIGFLSGFRLSYCPIVLPGASRAQGRFGGRNPQ